MDIPVRQRWTYRNVQTTGKPVLAARHTTSQVAAASIFVMVLFLIAVVSLFVGNSPLSVVKYRKGKIPKEHAMR
jgi:hypothetical protein